MSLQYTYIEKGHRDNVSFFYIETLLNKSVDNLLTPFPLRGISKGEKILCLRIKLFLRERIFPP